MAHLDVVEKNQRFVWSALFDSAAVLIQIHIRMLHGIMKPISTSPDIFGKRTLNCPSPLILHRPCSLHSKHTTGPVAVLFISILTLILLTWRIRWAPKNASRWQMGFNSAFKGLKTSRNERCTETVNTWRIHGPCSAPRSALNFVCSYGVLARQHGSILTES